MTNKEQQVKKLEQVFELFANNENDKAYQELKSVILEMSANIIKEYEENEDLIEMMDRDEGHDLAHDIAKNKKRVRSEEMYDEYDMDDEDFLDIDDGDLYEDEFEDDEDSEDDEEFDFDSDNDHDEHEEHHHDVESRVDDLEDEVEDLDDDFEALKKEFEELQAMDQEEDMGDDEYDMDEEEMEEARQMTDGMKGYNRDYKRDSKFYHDDLEDEIVSEAERLNKVNAKHPSHTKGKSPVGKTEPIDGIEADAPSYKKQSKETPSKHSYKTTKGTNTAKKGSDYYKKSDKGGYKK